MQPVAKRVRWISRAEQRSAKDKVPHTFTRMVDSCVQVRKCARTQTQTHAHIHGGLETCMRVSQKKSINVTLVPESLFALM
jgi:hypothetical protein